MFRLNTTLAITVRSSGTVFATKWSHKHTAPSTRHNAISNFNIKNSTNQPTTSTTQSRARSSSAASTCDWHSCHSMPSTYHVIYSVHRDFFGISRVFWLLRLINTLYLLTQGISKTDHKFHLHITCPYYIFPANSYITPHCTETAISLSDNRRQKSYGTITLSTPVQLQKNLSFRHKMD